MNKQIVAKELLKIAKDLTSATVPPWDGGQAHLNEVYRLLDQAGKRLDKFTDNVEKYNKRSDALQISDEIVDSWIPDIQQRIKELNEGLNALKKKAEKLG